MKYRATLTVEIEVSEQAGDSLIQAANALSQWRYQSMNPREGMGLSWATITMLEIDGIARVVPVVDPSRSTPNL